MDTVYIVLNAFGQIISVFSNEKAANDWVKDNETLSVEAWSVEN